MFKSKQQNETFRVNIEAFDAIQEAAKDAATAKILGISSGAAGKDFKHWAARDRQALDGAMNQTSISVTFLHSDGVFFIHTNTGSHVVIAKDKALLYSEALGKDADQGDRRLRPRVEFRVYSRVVNGEWCLLSALCVITDFNEKDLRILASWPMFMVEDEVFIGLGFEVERPDTSAYFTDEFGDDVYVSGVDYLKSGVRYTAL
ncbi:hypothetical protein OG496_12355 [Streptomyces sp. NBC_00988]|uniref:hypothetical protein n=1 Tax=Streptomyces sp. NBC_00988 TaxID=2903704 RepID=UPI00386385AF|nr:hypothetical protein OG496_12355 [Streptomyces sp. NBC_00988]